MSSCMFVNISNTICLNQWPFIPNTRIIIISDNYIETRLKNPKVKAFLHDLYNGPYHVDLSKKPKDDEPQASFRKLNVS